MIGVLLLLFASGIEKAPKPPTPADKTTESQLDTADDLEQATQAELAKVRRIYIDVLTGGDSALRIRDLLMSRIQATKQFIITEDEDKADAVLKGAGGDETFTDTFQSSDNINAHSQLSLPGMNNNTYNPVTGASTRYSDRISTSMGAGESDNQKIEERKHEAIATVRLVNKDGDVIWSATEESLGAKFVGASVDVVDRIAKKLAADHRRARVQARTADPAPK